MPKQWQNKGGEHLSIKFLNMKTIDEQILVDFSTDVHYSHSFDMREFRSAFVKLQINGLMTVWHTL